MIFSPISNSTSIQTFCSHHCLKEKFVLKISVVFNKLCVCVCFCCVSLCSTSFFSLCLSFVFPLRVCIFLCFLVAFIVLVSFTILMVFASAIYSLIFYSRIVALRWHYLSFVSENAVFQSVREALRQRMRCE